ncbi:transcription factor TGA2.3-like [Andrographis paniculata]|uniref:transcription factor TGA2.3-like n=1 Tax=Andrographis paniculata TaxID=175694 RepID=UPI0021E7AD7D|nr:transcription factor TGA2.3-like [Andrographis paniculata]
MEFQQQMEMEVQKNHNHLVQLDQQQQQQNHMSYGGGGGGVSSSSNSSSSSTSFNMISKDAAAAATAMANHDLGEFQFQFQFHGAFLQHLDAQNHPPRKISEINTFPSQPVHGSPSSTKETTNGSLVSASSTKMTMMPAEEAAEPQLPMLLIESNPRNSDKTKVVKRDENRKGPTSSSDQEGPKTPDPKTLRRLAQNREAARKSRLRKKAYVQQLESSSIRLAQLEHELQRARSQGFFVGGTSDQTGHFSGSINSEAALMFDMEYARWLEEHHQLMVVLRDALHNHLPENELQIYVESCLAHYGHLMNLKNLAAKSDVFHILSGMWKTPAERCLMWMGGFRPSELIKIVVGQIDQLMEEEQQQGLTEEQAAMVCGVQHSTRQSEQALTQALHLLHQSLTETLILDITSDISSISMATHKLAAHLQALLTQADTVRQQSLEQVQGILTVRQSAQSFLVMAEYFHRLRALTGLWLARPRRHSSSSSYLYPTNAIN